MGEVRQWYVRTTKFGLLHDRTNGCLAVQVLDRTCGNNLRLCVRFQGCENYGGSGQSMHESTILCGGSTRSSYLLDGKKNCNNIANVNQYLVKPTEVFLPDTKEPESESNDIARAYVLHKTCGSWAQTRAPDFRHSYLTRYRASEHHLHIGRRSVSGRRGTHFGCHRGKEQER